MRSFSRKQFLLPLVLLVLTVPSISAGAPVWIDRALTLPRHDFAFDAGFGVGHLGRPSSVTGTGMNLEGSVGVTRRLELGFRGGIRFDSDGRATRADEYGRLFDRETFGTNNDSFANPEFRIRGGIAEGDVAELALEGRVALPIEDGSRISAQFGMPLRFHLGQSLRLDTGLYVPVGFYEPTYVGLSVPLDIWIQATDRLWLGPMTGLRYRHRGDAESTDVSLGFGLGYSITQAFDLKTMVLFPRVNETEGGRNVGGGFGIQVRIE